MLPCIAFAGPPEPAFFFFCLSFARPLSPAWRGWLSLIQVRRCPGFARNWVTRLQQGWSRALAVSFPYLALKIAHRPSQGRVCFFSPERAYPSPYRERGWVSSFLIRWVFNAEKPGAFPQEKTDTSYPRASLGSCQGNCWPQLAHTSPTRLVWGLAGVISLPGFQNRTRRHTGAEFGFHRLFLVRFFCGRPANCRSRW